MVMAEVGDEEDATEAEEDKRLKLLPR